MRMRKKKNLVPRMEACDACWIRRPEEHRGRWRELMPGARELRVELGCGKGRFTAETAKAEPRLEGMALVGNSRLSVQPVTEAEWKLICELCGLDPAAI